MIFAAALLLAGLNLAAANAHEAARAYASYYKKALPMRCNSNLVLNDLLALGDTLLYRYGVNDTKKTWVSKFNAAALAKYAEQTRKLNLAQICADREARMILDANITMDQVFYDADGGRLLFDYKIDKTDCLKLP